MTRTDPAAPKDRPDVLTPEGLIAAKRELGTGVGMRARLLDEAHAEVRAYREELAALLARMRAVTAKMLKAEAEATRAEEQVQIAMAEAKRKTTEDEELLNALETELRLQKEPEKGKKTP